MDAILGLQQVHQVVAALKVDGVVAHAVERDRLGQCVRVGDQHARLPRLKRIDDAGARGHIGRPTDGAGRNAAHVQLVHHVANAALKDAPHDDRFALGYQRFDQIKAGDHLGCGPVIHLQTFQRFAGARLHLAIEQVGIVAGAQVLGQHARVGRKLQQANDHLERLARKRTQHLLEQLLLPAFHRHIDQMVLVGLGHAQLMLIRTTKERRDGLVDMLNVVLTRRLKGIGAHAKVPVVVARP